jgi:hypothetical protein
MEGNDLPIAIEAAVAAALASAGGDRLVLLMLPPHSDCCMGCAFMPAAAKSLSVSVEFRGRNVDKSLSFNVVRAF